MRLASPAALLGMMLSALIAAMPTGPAHAAWPSSPYLNVMVPSVGGAQMCAVAEDGRRGAFVVYEDLSMVGSQGINLRAHHVLPGGVFDPAWGLYGIAICTSTGGQTNVRVAPDGSGGFYAVWQDARGGTSDIYAVRIGANGTVASGWTAGGKSIGGVAAKDDSLISVAVAPDGSLYVGWEALLSPTDHDVYVTHYAASGSLASGWPSGGLDLFPSGAMQSGIVLAANPASGVDVAYENASTGNLDIVGGRLNANGTTAWSVTYCGNAAAQTKPQIVADGYGGAYVAWADARPGAGKFGLTRIGPNGLRAAGWSVDGNFPITGAPDGPPLQLLSDGTAGVYVAFIDHITIITTAYFIAVCRVLPYPAMDFQTLVLGLFDANFSARVVPGAGGDLYLAASVNQGAPATGDVAVSVVRGGIADAGSNTGVSLLPGDQSQCAAVSDGAGGVLAFWTDARLGDGTTRIFGQRVAYGPVLGDPDPAIAGVRDVRNDQGGQVRVSWTPGLFDVQGADGLLAYRVWRQAPAEVAQALLERGEARLAGDAAAARAGTRVLRTSVEGSQVHYWEEMGSVRPIGLAGYSMVVPTTGDSVGGSNPYTLFAVSIEDSSGNWWMSPPDSGYSVDDLAPAAPTGANAMYTPANGTVMAWASNLEPDLAGYRVHRGADVAFVPGPANLVGATALPSFQDPVTGAFYKVCAVDVHGNVSAPTLVLPGGTLASDAVAPRELALHPVVPNPSRGTARLAFAVPRATRVRIEVFDAQGRRVRVLADELRAPGEWSVAWDGRGATGERLGPGLYVARLSAEGRTFARRLVRID